MILFIEPISKNIGMYVPAYPLPSMEIASFVKSNLPETEIGIISVPVDYGLPLNIQGKDKVYRSLLREIAQIRPKGIGISCTAIAQAEEAIQLCELIKVEDPDIFLFLGGYFPTVYYEEIFARTRAVDVIVIGEGEVSSLEMIRLLEKGMDPKQEHIPNLAWMDGDQIHLNQNGVRFDLNKKALLNLDLLRHPRAYDIMPYAFSRGCPYHCNFCMEEHIRPYRKAVPDEIIRKDLENLSSSCSARSLLISDALFRSFNMFPYIRSLGMKVTFETRCDVLDPALIPELADVCGMLVLGFESASYDTLRRMNKVRDEAHYRRYISNTRAIFREAVRNEIPLMMFMIAGYPGDSEKDLEESLVFVKELSKEAGVGGHVFKIGECHVYPKTKIHDLAKSLSDVVFDDDGVFGQNVVRRPSKDLDFDTVLDYTNEIFNFSKITNKLQNAFQNMMPLFRLPVTALHDEMIPDTCFEDVQRDVLRVHGESLSEFKSLIPPLTTKYREWMSKERINRSLPF